jgi:uncharacterized membrane protein YcaP (DUF421 family)
MSNIALELLTVSIHTLVIYIFLVLGLSLLGHRETSQLGLVEIVIIMVLGSAVETAMVAGDTSLQAGLVAAAILMLCNRGLTRLFERFRWLRRAIIGHPITLVDNGRILTQQAQAVGLSEDDILEGIRERGYNSLDQVRYAILEADGNISVIAKDAGKERKQGSQPEKSDKSHKKGASHARAKR